VQLTSAQACSLGHVSQLQKATPKLQIKEGNLGNISLEEESQKKMGVV